MKFRLLLVAIIATGTIGCSDKGGSSDGGSEIFSTSENLSGKVLFTSRVRGGCSICHKTTDKKLVGPGLAGIKDRHSREWLVDWIMDPQGMWEGDHPETAEMKKRLNKEHMDKTAMKLMHKPTRKEAEAITDYLLTL